MNPKDLKPKHWYKDTRPNPPTKMQFIQCHETMFATHYAFQFSKFTAQMYVPKNYIIKYLIPINKIKE